MVKRGLLVISFFIIFFSCSRVDEVDNLLSDVETYIEKDPQKVLDVLQRMDKEVLGSSYHRARYSLLYSMALDKNYIDMTDFSVLQPAIDYYEKKGSPTERLRMYYYQGRIFRNAGDDESAMECYVRGVHVGKKSDDFLTSARLQFSKAQIHSGLFEHEEYAEGMLLAAKYFEKGGNMSSYLNSLLNAFNGYLVLRDTIKAEELLQVTNSKLDTSNMGQVVKYYEAKISFGAYFQDKALASEYIREFLDKVDEGYIPWLSLANAYLDIGEYGKGLEALDRWSDSTGDDLARYYVVSSQLYEGIGDLGKALENYKRYINISDSLDMRIFKQDTKFIEERYRLKMDVLEEKLLKQRYIISGIILVAILCGAIVLIRMKLKARNIEVEEFKTQCAHLELERIKLQDVLNNNMIIDDAVRETILKRLELLDAFFVANIVDDWKGYESSVDALRSVVEDRKDFMETNCMAFRLKYPRFVGYLETRGLSEMEIKFCCLYALGLSGKEIGAYTKMSRHYKVSSSIRNKLELGIRDMNLDKYIIVLLERYS